MEVNDDSVPYPPSDHIHHHLCPSDCAYNDMICDTKEFDKYSRIVSECQGQPWILIQKPLKKGLGHYKKMKGILDQNFYKEVDYDKAAKDMSSVMVLWRAVNVSGKRAFITTI